VTCRDVLVQFSRDCGHPSRLGRRKPNTDATCLRKLLKTGSNPARFREFVGSSLRLLSEAPHQSTLGFTGWEPDARSLIITSCRR
jgi:hypothetical protein